MRIITGDEFAAFIAATPVAVVHFDAEWDAVLREPTREAMRDAQRALGAIVAFAEIDANANVRISNAIGVANIPMVAYFRDAQLVAALVGAGQNVRARVERVLRGESIGRGDGTSR